MTIGKQVQYTSTLLLSILIASCGDGASTSLTNSIEPEAGSANPDAEHSSVQSVSGRVADGYIQGATVCVDLNENDACDEGEPSAVTGAGGIYDLEIPEGAEEKPIVAAIPAEAIDEDTGTPVGKAMVFIAPADKPEFLSPITTLVQQELRSNPALNVEEAERSVKTILGIDESDVSLFADYVAKSDASTSSAETADKFKYLHDTARVVASLMKDIETQVETAAVSKGVDVTGDEDTQRAIKDIVRSEVRDLLPQIAKQVAEIVGGEQTEGEGGANTEAFDPDALAIQLRPTDAADDVDARIEAVKERVEVVESDMRQILSDGVYWMEFDCEYEHASSDKDIGTVNSDAAEDNDSQGSSYDILEGNYLPEPKCTALYGHVQLGQNGDTMESEEYLFDSSTGAWSLHDRDLENQIADYSLVNGEWIAMVNDGPSGDLVFNDDGSVVVANDAGTMHLKAVTQQMDGAPIVNHLWEDGADPLWFDLVEPTDLFASGSIAHRISVRESNHPFVLFNYQPANESEEDYCVNYNGNCNVVNQYNDGQYVDLFTLDSVRESALQSLEIVTHSVGDGSGVLMKLSAIADEDGQLPQGGTVHWDLGFDPYYQPNNGDTDFGYEHSGTSPTGETRPYECYPAPEVYPGELVDTGDHTKDVDLTEGPFPHEFAAEELPFKQVTDPDDLQKQVETLEELQRLEMEGIEISQIADEVDESATIKDESDSYPGYENCYEYNVETGIEEKINASQIADDTSGYTPDEMFTSEWSVVEEQGVTMIQVQLPLLLRHDDIDSTEQREEAILLIEQNGFVRLGARLPDMYIDRVYTYNETAFATLKSIVEVGFSR